ncbi:MAG: RrF2 family transcriptional regulator [Elusimicrobiota bacterium]
MGQCLNISQGGEYAIASLARLALGFPEAVPVSILARTQGVPAAFLAKILGRCAKAGIVRSRTGPSGGMSLARSPELIPVLDIIEACEGPLERARCVFYSERPCAGTDCLIYCPLRRKEENMRRDLRETTLADMARSLQDHPLSQGGREWTQRRAI